jgi:SRSO17 transposase
MYPKNGHAEPIVVVGVNEDLGSPDGVLVFDESGFIKKGQDSVGVARQYCGTAGKVDNCQVGVFAAYVSDHGYAMVDKRLFIPEQWFSEEYYERRQKCNMPEDSVFQTKPQLAAEMLMDIHSENVLPFKYVLADSIYGVSPEFIGAVENLPGITYFVSVPKKTLCWLKRPMTISKRYRWGSYATKDPCLAQRLAMGDRTVFRGSQNRVGHGPLRSAQVYGLASSHPHVHNGTFLSLAPEDQVGGKKHHLLRYRSLEFCSNYCY